MLNQLPSNDQQIQDLLEHAQAGSDSALGELLELFRDQLHRSATTQMDPRIRVKLSESDVIQNTMLIAAHSFPQFRGTTKQSLQVWLLTILHGQIVDGLRRFKFSEKRREERESNSGTGDLQQIAGAVDTPSKAAMQSEQAQALLSVIVDLPPELRQVVQLKYINQMTLSEIARLCEIPTTTCRRRWLIAVDQIGKRMGKHT